MAWKLISGKLFVWVLLYLFLYRHFQVRLSGKGQVTDLPILLGASSNSVATNLILSFWFNINADKRNKRGWGSCALSSTRERSRFLFLRQTSLQTRAHSAPGSKWFDWTQSVFALISHDQLALLWFQTRQARVIGRRGLFGQQPSLSLELRTIGFMTWRAPVGLVRQQGQGQHLALCPEVALVMTS